MKSNPKWKGEIKMETEFSKKMSRLCQETGITPARAFMDGAGMEPGPAVKKMKNGWVPDEDILCQLANYFGIGADEFMGSPGKRLCYLAGPINGRPNFMEEFQEAKEWLEQRGEFVCSPAHMSNSLPTAQMERKHFMQLGIALLSICGKIAVMPGWETSSGCQMEVAYAKANGMEIAYLSEIGFKNKLPKEDNVIKKLQKPVDMEFVHIGGVDLPVGAVIQILEKVFDSPVNGYAIDGTVARQLEQLGYLEMAYGPKQAHLYRMKNRPMCDTLYSFLCSDEPVLYLKNVEAHRTDE